MINPELTYIVEIAERLDTISSVKLAAIFSQLEASSMFSLNEELCYNEIVCQWMTIYIYIYIWGGGYRHDMVRK